MEAGEISGAAKPFLCSLQELALSTSSVYGVASSLLPQFLGAVVVLLIADDLGVPAARGLFDGRVCVPGVLYRAFPSFRWLTRDSSMIRFLLGGCSHLHSCCHRSSPVCEAFSFGGLRGDDRDAVMAAALGSCGRAGLERRKALGPRRIVLRVACPSALLAGLTKL